MGDTSNTNFQTALSESIQALQSQIAILPHLLTIEATTASEEAPYLAQEEADVTTFNNDYGWMYPGTYTESYVASIAWNWSEYASGEGRNALHNFCLQEEALQPYQTAMTKVEGQIKSIDPHIGGLLVAYNRLIETTDALSVGGIQGFDKEIESLQKMIQDLYTMIINRVTKCLADKVMHSLGANELESPEGQLLQNMINTAMDNERAASEDYSQRDTLVEIHAQQQKVNASDNEQVDPWWDQVADFFGAHDGPDIGLDQQIVQQMTGLLSALTKIGKHLVSFTFIDTHLQTLFFQLELLTKEFHAFLEGQGNLQEIKGAMIEAFAIMVDIIAETSKKSSSYEKEMSQGAIQLSKAKLDQSLDEQQVIDAARKYSAIMGTILDVAKYLGLAIILCLNPSAAMALMVVIDAILNATGVMNKLQNALSEKLGNVWGAVLTGLIETVGTVGGAAALEKGLAALATAAAEQGTARSVEACIQTTIKETELTGAKDAETNIRTTLDLAVKTAQDKVVAGFAAKSIPRLLYALLQGDLKVAIQAAQKEAARLASRQLQLVINADTKLAENELEDIANRSASKAVATAMKLSGKDATKLSTQEMKQLVVRLGGMTAASMGSTQMINQLVKEWSHKHQLNEGAQISLEFINMLLQLIGMIGSCLGGGGMEIGPGFTSKLLSVTTTVDGLTSSIGDAGQAEACFEQAAPIKQIAKDQAAMDLMHFVLEQLQKDANQERSAYVREIEQMSKSNNQMAVHLNDAETAVVRALQAMAV